MQRFGNFAGQARLVMRQRGNLRLLLNANLWPKMPVSMMDGGKVRLPADCYAAYHIIHLCVGCVTKAGPDKTTMCFPQSWFSVLTSE